jgi:hypothetical protein
MAAKVSRMNKTVSIRSEANPLWKKAAKMVRYFEDKNLGDFITEHLERYVENAQKD